MVQPQDSGRLVQGQVTLAHAPSLRCVLRLGDIINITYIMKDKPMAGVKGKSGRHKSEVGREGFFLRLRPEVMGRVKHCRPLLELQEGVTMSTAEALEHLLTLACEAVERTREGREAPAHTSILGISEISNGVSMAYDDMLACLDAEDEEPPTQPVDVPQASETPTAAAEPSTEQTPSRKRSAWNKLPQETLQALADEWTLCQGLSYSEFAQRLHEKGIYSATAKDGRKVPVSTGKVSEWLKRAEGQGLL